MPLATPIAGSTNFCPIQPDFGVARLARGQDRPFDPDDPVARLPCPEHRQGRDRRSPAAGLRSQASRRPSDGLARPMAGARARGAGARISTTGRLALCTTGSSTRCREGYGRVNGLAQTAALETEICGQRLWARRAEKGPLNPRNPAAETGSIRTGHGNVGLFPTLGNHVGLRRLPGGAEGIRTPDLCSAIAALSHLSYSPVARLFTCASNPCQRRRRGGSRLLRGIAGASKFRKNSCARSSTLSSTPLTFTSL